MSASKQISRRFPRTARLLTSRDYGWVFEQPQRSRDRYFTVLFRQRGQRQRSRLGLAVSRKAERRAVARNRLKRLVRESFRLHQCQLRGIDLVVMAKPGAAAGDNSELSGSLARHWRTAAKRTAQRRPERS